MKNRKNPKRKKKRRLGFLLATVLLAGAALFTMARLDGLIMPMALDVAERRLMSDIAALIDGAYSSIIEEQHIEAADLFTASADAESGKVGSAYVDTLLVNEICNKLAARVAKDMNALGRQTVDVPLGSLSGYQAFADAGPYCRVSLRPSGGARVEARSESEAVGINQVNLLVWLDVKCEARIVAPFQKSREITVTRSLPLINTYFSHDVPNTYMNGSNGSVAVGHGK